MAVLFTKFITKKWAVLARKIDKLFIVIGINKKSHVLMTEAAFMLQPHGLDL